MCCRMTVHPLNKEIAEAILILGEFVLINPGYWRRNIPEESTSVDVNLNDNCFHVSMLPAIHTPEQHAQKRITAGVYFEIATKYAEKVGGEIVQLANVFGCRESEGVTQKKLASYPSQPMMYDNICNGFKAVFIGEAYDN